MADAGGQFHDITYLHSGELIPWFFPAYSLNSSIALRVLGPTVPSPITPSMLADGLCSAIRWMPAAVVLGRRS